DPLKESPLEKGRFAEYRLLNLEEDFNKIVFSYGGRDQLVNSDYVLDIIYWPRNTEIDLGTLQNKEIEPGRDYLDVNNDLARNVQRLMYYSMNAETASSESFPHLNLQAMGGDLLFQERLAISNLRLAEYNYLIRYQSIGRDDEIAYRFETSPALANGKTALPGQMVAVEAGTATLNMFQRLRQQEPSFAPLQPGLSFVLFSDQNISR
ncbi:MAG TPA: hypothetical protein PLQ36_03445, partial [Candidatus Gracilibacteria bacterium]|nr:hypothetical protein [Candidatus Gracilibacteria bacterium]